MSEICKYCGIDLLRASAIKECVICIDMRALIDRANVLEHEINGLKAKYEGKAITSKKTSTTKEKSAMFTTPDILWSTAAPVLSPTAHEYDFTPQYDPEDPHI